MNANRYIVQIETDDKIVQHQVNCTNELSACYIAQAIVGGKVLNVSLAKAD